MADLGFLAAGVQEDEQWTRKTERTKQDNPFLPKIMESWEGRQKIGTGANAKVRGTAFSVQVTTHEQMKLVRNALIRGGRELEIGVGIAYFGPPRESDGPDNGMRELLGNDVLKTAEGWDKYSGGNVLIKFRAQPKRRVVEDQEDATSGTVTDEDADVTEQDEDE